MTAGKQPSTGWSTLSRGWMSRAWTASGRPMCWSSCGGCGRSWPRSRPSWWRGWTVSGRGPRPATWAPRRGWRRPTTRRWTRPGRRCAWPAGCGPCRPPPPPWPPVTSRSPTPRRLAILCAPDTAAAFAAAEEFLGGQARSMRWADFTKACGYWLRQARRDKDPDPYKPDRDHRRVSLHDGMRGTGLLSGELTPTAKAEVRCELDRLERRLFEADWAAATAVHGEAVTAAHLARTPAQRRHDALVEMARRSATAPTAGKRPRAPTVPDNGRPQCRPHHRQHDRVSVAPGDHHPTPTTATASPAAPTSNSPEPASATASSTTPPGAPSPPHPTRHDARVRGSRPRPGRARWRRGRWRRSPRRGRPP
jgi:hypothetical protein